MAESAPAGGQPTPGPPWRTALLAAAVCGFILLHYWALLSDGRFFQVAPVRYDFVFNSMIEYMARGRFDVDPGTILQEGFSRDGRTYAWFGVMPALPRLPLLIFPRLRTVDFTAMFCAIAATIAAVAKLAAVLQAGRAMGDKVHRRRVLAFAMAIVVFGGAQVQFLRPSVYQESLYWASAIAALFVFLAFRWCVDVSGRKSGHLTIMSGLAGLCLLTRVSTSIGLYAACGAMMLPDVIAAVRGKAPDAPRKILLPALILGMFAVLCGVINQARWGSPFTFQDYRYYNLLRINDPAYDVLLNYGYFNVRRTLFGLGYFFVPIWTMIGSDGHFLFRAFQDRMYYTVELPPATFFISDPMLCFLIVLGCAWLWRRCPPGVDQPVAGMVAVSLIVPGILIMMAIALTFRYRMEFYPCFEFLALFGLFGLAEKMAVRPRVVTAACGALVAISIVSSHAFLLAYKVSPWGDAAVIEDTGWVAAYRQYFRVAYPGIDRALGSR